MAYKGWKASAWVNRETGEVRGSGPAKVERCDPITSGLRVTCNGTGDWWKAESSSLEVISAWCEGVRCVREEFQAAMAGYVPSAVAALTKKVERLEAQLKAATTPVGYVGSVDCPGCGSHLQLSGRIASNRITWGEVEKPLKFSPSIVP